MQDWNNRRLKGRSGRDAAGGGDGKCSSCQWSGQALAEKGRAENLLASCPNLRDGSSLAVPSVYAIDPATVEDGFQHRLDHRNSKVFFDRPCSSRQK